MSGDKFTEALRACSILEESLKGIANVKIVMFDYDGDVRHRVIKSFKELNKGNASWTFSNKQRSGNCNMDGFSIRVATKELLKRNERRKILFTLSDMLFLNSYPFTSPPLIPHELPPVLQKLSPVNRQLLSSYHRPITPAEQMKFLYHP